MGFVVTWQGLWMLVGSGFEMVNFWLERWQRGLISDNLGVYIHLEPSRSTYLQGTPNSVLVGGVLAEHTRNRSEYQRSTNFRYCQ